MKIKKKTYMEEENKVSVRITSDDIIIGDFPYGNYNELVKLIACNECKLLFDSDVNYNAFMKKLEPYINEEFCVGLAECVKDLIAEQYALQVSTNSL